MLLFAKKVSFLPPSVDPANGNMLVFGVQGWGLSILEPILEPLPPTRRGDPSGTLYAS